MVHAKGANPPSPDGLWRGEGREGPKPRPCLPASHLHVPSLQQCRIASGQASPLDAGLVGATAGVFNVLPRNWPASLSRSRLPGTEEGTP